MDNKIVGIIVSILVSLIMVGGVLSPIISSVGGDLGDPIKLEQTGSRSPYRLGEVPANDTVTFSVESDGVKINGSVLELQGAISAWTPIIYTDGGYIQIRNETGATKITVFTVENLAEEIALSAGNSVIFDNGVCTINATDVTTFDYTVCYSVGYDDNIRMIIDMGMRYDNAYSIVNSIKDVTIYGWYYTGENDTQYSFENGVLSVVGDYVATCDYELTLHDGTTDIYDITEFNITVGGETFVPYFALVPDVVEGHADNGVAYNLVGIIPMLVIVGVLLMAVGLIFRSRY